MTKVEALDQTSEKPPKGGKKKNIMAQSHLSIYGHICVFVFPLRDLILMAMKREHHIWVVYVEELAARIFILSATHICRVRNLKFATYLKFGTCENTNKINELW